MPIWKHSIAIFLFLGLSQPSFCGTTGKITGQVTDQNGDPLPGAAVLIEGTTLGSLTDAAGVYILLTVDPGKHTLIADMVGYESHKKTDVLVTSDLTVNESFILKEAPLELGEVVVEAQSGQKGGGMLTAKANEPLVEVDKTTSLYIVRADDIEALSIVQDMAEFIELQAGVAVDEDGDEISVRAGNPEDVAYYVDGILLPTNDYISHSRVYRDFNRLSVQEMMVVTGGMNAEYGNAQGGLVNIVTREGRQSYSGLADYELTLPGQKHWGANAYDSPIHQGNARWDDPEWVAETVTLPDGREVPAHRRLDYTGVWSHFLEGNLSGPLAKDLSMFTSARWRREASAFPGPHLSTPFNLNTTLKLTRQWGQNFKLRVGGLSDRRRKTTDRSLGTKLDVRDSGRYLFLADPNSVGDQKERDYLIYAAITHLLSPNTFYEVRMAQSVSKLDTVDVPLPTGITHISESANVYTPPIFDQANHYMVANSFLYWDRFHRNRLNLKVDLSSQVNRKHLLKAGFELIRYNNWFQRYVGRGWRHSFWYGRTYEDTDFFPGQKNRGVNPIQLGIYAQDKIELGGMVVNAGIRFEALFQNTEVTDRLFYRSPMWNRATRVRNAPKTKGPTLKSWSPRLGISHPLGENSVIRFFYGRFAQFPNFGDLFLNRWTFATPDRDLNDNGVIDPAERWNGIAFETLVPNPYLSPEETISFEVGFDWNMVTDYVLGLTTYYKTANHQISRNAERDVELRWSNPSTGKANPWPYVGTSTQPGLLRDTRGLELSLKKRLSHLFAFNFALNMQWADRSLSWASQPIIHPDSLFIANGHFWTRHTVDPSTGAEIPLSLEEMARQEGKPADFYIQKYGHSANQAIRDNHGGDASSDVVLLTGGSSSNANDVLPPWNFQESRFAAEGVAFVPGQTETSFYSDQDRAFWEKLSNTLGYPGKGEGNLLMDGGLAKFARTGVARDRRMFGSLTLLFQAPSGRGLFGSTMLGNLRANLVYRLYTGTPFEYVPTVHDPNAPGGVRALPPSQRYGPMHTRTDLNIEKNLGNPTGRRVSLGLAVFNLFNQKDVRSVASFTVAQQIDFDEVSWQRWGISGRTPSGNAPVEVFDINNYWDAPREVTFNIRVKW